MPSNKKNAIIFDIQHGSYVDGPGMRTVVFLKGCNLACAWCHNPESHNPNCQRMWYKHKCRYCGKCADVCSFDALEFDRTCRKLIFYPTKCNLCGKCAKLCPSNAIAICGYMADTDELLRKIKKDRLFYDASNGGVTISGGECMLHPFFVADLLNQCRNAGILTAVDTAGNVPWENFEKILKYTDLFLYDIVCTSPLSTEILSVPATTLHCFL